EVVEENRAAGGSCRAGAHGIAEAPTRRDGRTHFRTRETGRISLPNSGSARTATTPRNSALELLVRPRNSLSDLQFTVRSARAREQNGGFARPAGLEPATSWFVG